MEEKQLSFEEANVKLDEIVKRLESGQGSLEEMIGLYQEGIRMYHVCAAILDSFEQKLSILAPDGEDQE